MSFACVYGGECDGCMRCQEQRYRLLCDWCGKEIYDDDSYYDIKGDCVCEECIESCKE
jgi:hypothetical protein